MEKLALHTPFLYTLYSRGGVFCIINNYLYGPLTITLYAFFFSTLEVNFLESIIVTVVCFLLFYLMYEVGYLMNDLWSIKTEKKPVTRTEIDYPTKSILLFILIRFLSMVTILSLVYYFSLATDFFFYTFIFLLAVLFLIYIFHNFIHLLDLRLRVVSFALLKMSFWFIPSSYLFLQLDRSEQVLFAFLFAGALSFYLYSYTTTKKWWLGFTFSLPYDLELRLLLFMAPFMVFSFFLSYSVYWQFVLFACGYFLGFTAIRKVGRLLK